MVKIPLGAAARTASFSLRSATRTARIGPLGGVSSPNRLMSALLKGRSQANPLPATAQVRLPRVSPSVTSGRARAISAASSSVAMPGNRTGSLASVIVDPAIEEYALAHTTAPTPALVTLIEETKALGPRSGMMTGPVEGRFLEFLVFALQPRLVLEIGTFTGYSSISMASVLPTGARLITCDIEEKAHAAARRHAEQAGVVDRIDYRLGPALDTIAALDGPFDLVFIDADKPNYANYYEGVLPKLSQQGIIAVDNTLWNGRVLDPSADDEGSVAIKAFNDRVIADERVVSVLLTVRDGVTLIRKA